MSSKRNLRKRCCTRKAVYGNAEDAWRAVRRVFWTYRTLLHVYECPFCGQFHVGHPPIEKRTRSNFKQLT